MFFLGTDVGCYGGQDQDDLVRSDGHGSDDDGHDPGGRSEHCDDESTVDDRIIDLWRIDVHVSISQVFVQEHGHQNAR